MHTPEPWFATPDRRIGHHSAQAVLTVVAEVNGPNAQDRIAERDANAARIVQCVNACAGMVDPAKSLAALYARIDHLERTIRDAGGHC